MHKCTTRCLVVVHIGCGQIRCVSAVGGIKKPQTDPDFRTIVRYRIGRYRATLTVSTGRPTTYLMALVILDQLSCF